MQVIRLEEEAFYTLLEKSIEYLESKRQDAPRKWIGETEAVAMLDGVSKSTLQRLRNNGDIGFTQPSRKIILYDRESINDYLEKHAKKPFK
ncbi:helix-turn-helix domain-containing protein [Maribacter sp. 2304DJ31-5]|uniref:helix-turn-helix domain-containing protein n=1 Tax=Maribacter sp. 2304DJ31-5 TaxID=3386273 RepID=UPI0039BC6DA1